LTDRPTPRGTLPFFYGWIVVAAAFVTMAIGVNARTAFSLLFPPILDEFGWERGLTAGAFSFGFLVSACLSPLVGRLMDRRGPRFVIEMGVLVMGCGLLLAPFVSRPWHLYATLGVLVGGGGNCLGYTGQSLYLPNWFVRRRGLAMSLAFSGVGIGSIVLLPWLQALIARAGWRAACWTLGVLVLGVLAPLNLALKRRPEDLGLQPDGDIAPRGPAAARRTNVVDAAWAAVDWTLARAMQTSRFWWIALGYFFGLFAWYAVQVHQTKYLVEVGFSPARALLRGAPGTPERADGGAALPDGDLAGFPRLRPHLGARRNSGRDLRGPSLRRRLRYAHAGGDQRRRRGAVGGGRSLRRHGQLHAGVLDRHRRLRAVSARHLARGAS
jgi:MFS family permease